MPKNVGQRSQKARREWIQIDALACGTGWDEKDLTKPQILIEDVFGASHPGSYHLDGLAQEASIGVFQEGGRYRHKDATGRRCIPANP
jgi:dihydroxy-acid dehydratase